MSTTNSQVPFDNGSAANFKAWGSFISAAFTNAGWTQTSDSGQVVWSSNPSVPAASTYLYQIWQPADSLQSTNPYVVKVEFGNNGGGTNYPSIRLTIGVSTNGSGTITGAAILGPLYVNANNSQIAGAGATTYNCYSSGDTGRIGILMWREAGTTTIPEFFGIERTLNSSGAAISDGVTLLTVGGGNNNNAFCQQRTLMLSPSVALANAYGFPLVLGVFGNSSAFPAGYTSDALGSSVPISPVFPNYGKFGNPMTIAARACPSDIVEAATITTTLYGATRTFLCTKNGVGFTYFGAGTNNNSAFLMRYD